MFKKKLNILIIYLLFCLFDGNSAKLQIQATTPNLFPSILLLHMNTQQYSFTNQFDILSCRSMTLKISSPEVCLLWGLLHNKYSMKCILVAALNEYKLT